ncbi:UNKNOWN [Stylonychia lemnae]|uniref:Uncharacterized protein n=1 Tax=Stylonychia lemnae TaxID=5949 RepID=A0A078AM24_STYLE|nr:UNKNOWN [Stylonychia lemnae]|eukprot:CDW83279.1 UNKNOWN [Stylonychia lemnae]
MEEENLKLFSQHEQQAAELQVYELIKFQQVQEILKKQEEEDFLFAQMIDQQSDRSDLANKLVPIVVGENQIESNKNQVDEVQNNQESSERDDEVQKEKVCLLSKNGQLNAISALNATLIKDMFLEGQCFKYNDNISLTARVLF